MAQRRRAQRSGGKHRSDQHAVGPFSRSTVQVARTAVAGGLVVAMGLTAFAASTTEPEAHVAVAPRNDVVSIETASAHPFAEEVRSAVGVGEESAPEVQLDVPIDHTGAVLTSSVESIEPAPAPPPVRTATPQAASSNASSGATGGSVSTNSSAPATNRGELSPVLAEAEKYIGVRYTAGGKNPSQGFDCSGFTAYVMGQLGYSIPSSSAAVYSQAQSGKLGRLVSASELQPGDLMVWRAGDGGRSGHTAFYAGGGLFIDASRPGVPVDYRPISRPNAAAPLYVRFID